MRRASPQAEEIRFKPQRTRRDLLRRKLEEKVQLGTTGSQRTRKPFRRPARSSFTRSAVNTLAPTPALPVTPV